MKELLEKLGVIVDEDADLDTTATAIRTKIAEVLKHDPDFIEPIKTEATKKATEQAIVAEKKAKKAFKINSLKNPVRHVKVIKSLIKSTTVVRARNRCTRASATAYNTTLVLQTRLLYF
jgi:hypothetical protein